VNFYKQIVGALPRDKASVGWFHLIPPRRPKASFVPPSTSEAR
jgi:hypothetical protein